MTTRDPEQLLVSIAQILEQLNIPYAITGGMSVVVWGRPRFTADIDVVADPTSEQVEGLISAFHNLGEGVYVDDVMIREAHRMKGECNIIDSTIGVKVDIWFGGGERVQRELDRRVQKKIGNNNVYFLSPEDLILSKLIWFQKSQSTRHLEDIESVLAVSGDQVDTEYVSDHSQQLGLSQLWRKVSEKVLPAESIFSYEYAFFVEQGPRPAMEDFLCVIDERKERGRLYCGVYDGHRGSEVSKMASEDISKVFYQRLDQDAEPIKAFQQAYAFVDERVSNPRAGSCALDVFIQSDGQLWFAYAGDSRLLVVNEDGVRQLTTDHRLDNPIERERIKQAGGVILGRYFYKNEQGLEATRSLGDHYFRDVGMISAPETKAVWLHPSDKWLLLATDGVFDVFSNEEITIILRKHSDCNSAIVEFKDVLLSQKNITDNVTVILIKIAVRR